ncbi:DUF1971 domain-containing protein [Pseudomonas rustica]|uniref:DUF1971 domain-containing protein n=1 Tax=Pseudomonas rustica TaxID=2827099 RepID=UPI003CF9CF81
MKNIPDQLTAYKKTPIFTERSVPAGLLNDHQTKQGVWGKIVVLEGELLYIISNPEEKLVLSVENFGVVEPTVIHQVKPLGEVTFYVEFYR